jgi:SNF2 family DNA or RNA helicase
LIKIHHHVESDPEALESISKDVAELARLVLQEGVANTDRWEAAGELDWRLRQATGIAKAPYVADFVRMLHQTGGGKILLYGWHRSVYDIWLDKLKDLKPVMYTGSESPRQKLNAFEAFTKGDAHILLMSLRAGAGLDGLQGSCNNVVFGELDWSPGVHEQAAGRVHRDGQKDSVAAYFLVSDSGSDPVVADVLGLKRQQSEGMRDPYGALIEKLDRGIDNIRRMATEYLRQRGESP